MAWNRAGRRLHGVAALLALVVASQLLLAAPAMAATDRKRPTVTTTTPQDSVVRQETPLETGTHVTGKASDDVSGIEYINISYCQAIHGPEGWSCGFLLSSDYGMATNDYLSCRSKRRSCTWSVPISGFDGPLTPGVYLFTAQVTDRAGRTSRSSKPVRIVVV